MFGKKSLDKFKEKIKNRDARIYKDYDDIINEYKNFSLNGLKKEKATISAKISADDWWIIRFGPSQLVTVNSLTIATVSAIISLASFFKDSLKIYEVLFLLVMMLFIIIYSSIGTGISSKKYDYVKPIYLENKLRLEIINQILEDRKNCKKVKVRVYKCSRK